MAGIAEVGAKDSKKPENEKGKVTIYFGIFFDGTNNHRLQVLIGKKYREKHGFTNTLSDDERQLVDEFTLDIYYKKDKKGIDSKQQKLTKKENELKEQLSSLKARLENRGIVDKDYYLLKNRIGIVEEELKGIQIEKSFDMNNRTLDELFQYDKENKKQQDVQTNGFTNIALLEPFYQAKEQESFGENAYAYRIYVTGSGTDRDVQKGENSWGLGFGQGDTGVGQKVIDAFNAVRSKLALVQNATSIKLEFCVFGFSRGATEARNFVYNLSNLSKAKGKENLLKVLNNDNIREYKVPFLGIYDTVSSVGVYEKLDSKQIRDTAINIGGRGVDSGIMMGAKAMDSGLDTFHEVKGWLLNTLKCKSDSGWEYKVKDHSSTHQYNVQNLGLYATTESYRVGKVLHICAADEYRENFALVDIKSSIESNGVEMFIPGAHADVGGGYNDADAEVKLETVPYYQPQINKTINKSLKIQREFLYNTEKKESTAVDSLRKLGWIDDENNIDYDHKHKRNITESNDRLVRFYSGAETGYNYIGLHLMKEYANIYSGNEIFKEIDRFKVPKDLENYTERIKKALLIKEKGTIDIRATQPNGRSDGFDYRKLRNKYLHFSSNYIRAKKFGVDAFHVNTPSIFEVKNEYEYRRIIYQGVSSDDNPKKKQNIEDSKLVSQYMNDMTKNNILSGATNIKERLIALFDILQDYISKQNVKAKSTLQKNLSSHKGNCTEEGYYRGKLKIRIDDKGDVNKTTKSFPNPYFEVGTMEIVVIPRGTIIDRYSGESGDFFGVPEFSKETRGIQPDLKEYKEHHIYITREPLIAIKSKVAPEGFGKLGRADQYELFFNVPGGNKIHKNCARSLISNGYIEQINDKDNPVNERE